MTTKDDGGPAMINHMWSADGGPAYPVTFSTENEGRIEFKGMSLRDWFAGQVLAGASTKWLNAGASDTLVAKWAYEIADAMLAARK